MKITLEDKDCAIIFKPDNSIKLYIPKPKNNDEVVDENLINATILVTLFADELFWELVNNRRKELFGDGEVSCMAIQ